MRKTRKQMVALLSRREQDGSSLRRLAEESGIPIGTLAWWSWRLRQHDPDPDDEHGGGFVEVLAAKSQERPGVAVIIGTDLRVDVSAGFDAELLRSVVRALQSWWPCRRASGSSCPAMRSTSARRTTACWR